MYVPQLVGQPLPCTGKLDENVFIGKAIRHRCKQLRNEDENKFETGKQSINSLFLRYFFISIGRHGR